MQNPYGVAAVLVIKKLSMNQENTTLPEFEGVFRFTNPTEEEFTTMWNSVNYTFPPMSTSPLIIPTESSENIQNIRKVFAKRLGIKYFYDSNRYNELNELTKKTGVPALIDIDKEPIFIDFIQKCLEPLPVARVTTKAAAKTTAPVSDHTKVIDEKVSLKANSTDASGDFDSLPDGE